jgi:hypothetical protein
MHTGAIETAEFDLAEHETATVHSGDTENIEYYEKLRTQFKVSLYDYIHCYITQAYLRHERSIIVYTSTLHTLTTACNSSSVLRFS